jgi:hypothetical protein
MRNRADAVAEAFNAWECPYCGLSYNIHRVTATVCLEEVTPGKEGLETYFVYHTPEDKPPFCCGNCGRMLLDEAKKPITTLRQLEEAL